MMKTIARNLVALLGTVTFCGCVGGGHGTGDGDPTTNPDPIHSTTDPRKVDFGLALRTAAIKLAGRLPTLDEINSVKDQASYNAQIDLYMSKPEFALQLISYFKDMMKMGGMIGTANLDAAPTFAAQLTFEDRDLRELFTATT